VIQAVDHHADLAKSGRSCGR